MVQSAKRFLFALWVKCRLCGSHRCRSAVLRQIEHLLALGGPGSTREFKPLDTLTLEQMKDACPDGPEASHTYSIAMLEGGQQAVDSLLALDLHVRFVATIASDQHLLRMLSKCLTILATWRSAPTFYGTMKSQHRQNMGLLLDHTRPLPNLCKVGRACASRQIC